MAEAQLAAHGTTEINSAADAAQALKPVVGTSRRFSLRSASSAPGCSPSPCYGLVAAGTVGGTTLSLLHVNPISLLLIVAIVNGLAAAPFLIVVLIIANNRELMGEHRNRHASNAVVGLTVALMTAAAITLVVTGGGG